MLIVAALVFSGSFCKPLGEAVRYAITLEVFMPSKKAGMGHSHSPACRHLGGFTPPWLSGKSKASTQLWQILKNRRHTRPRLPRQTC